MKRGFLFTIRVNQNERGAIAALAARLQRSQSDAVRFVVIEVAKQLAKAEPTPSVEYPKPGEPMPRVGSHDATA